jgi:hypothetical protein
MSDEEIKEKAPQVGDTVLVVTDDGSIEDEVEITEARELDATDGKYPVTCDDGEEYKVRWSDEEDTWIHEEGA